MKANYFVHERKYQEARAKGWPGWGGPDRMASGHIWLERLFSYRDLPRSGRVLDLGCGEGHYSRMLAESGYGVIGVDVSETAIAWAKEKLAETDFEIDFFALDLTQPDILQNEQFDLITDGNCLHCIIGLDRQTFLANVHRLLCKDGLFFVSTLLSLNDADHQIELEGKPYRHAPSEANLRNELEVAGFSIEKFVAHPRWSGSSNPQTRHATVHLRK